MFAVVYELLGLGFLRWGSGFRVLGLKVRVKGLGLLGSSEEMSKPNHIGAHRGCIGLYRGV